MSSDWQVEASQPISRQTIGTSLEQDGVRSEVLNYFRDDRLENHIEALVIKPLIKGKVDSMIWSRIFSHIIDVSSSREVVLEFMERAGHDSICQVEGLFHAITMVNIDVDVEDPLESFEQL